MRTLTIRIERDSRAALRRAGDAFRRAWKTRRYQGEVRSFESPAALFRVHAPVFRGVCLNGCRRLVRLPFAHWRALSNAT